MFETMYDAPGIGLAAVQVGVPKRLLVIDLQEGEDAEGKPVKDPRVFINPRCWRKATASFPTRRAGLHPEQYAKCSAPTGSRSQGRDADGRPQEGEIDGCWRSACSMRSII
jgi:peptide deformylase